MWNPFNKKAEPSEEEKTETYLGNLKNELKEAQASLVGLEKDYDRAESLALAQKAKLEDAKKDPELTRGQLERKEYRFKESTRKVDALDRANKRLRETVGRFTVAIEGVVETMESQANLDPAETDNILKDLYAQRQVAEESSRAANDLNDFMVADQVPGSSLDRINESASVDEDAPQSALDKVNESPLEENLPDKDDEPPITN